MTSRVTVPKVLAARVLFLSDRTCCVCRQGGKAVQIHHMDDDPSNNAADNLSVLCFDCHRETQVKGGFDRKLDSEQVRLYRDSWLETVRQRRALVQEIPTMAPSDPDERLSLVTALLEIYREFEDYLQLARLHASLGNDELRDKYVELGLAANPPSWKVLLLRRVQDRTDLVPPEVVKDAIKGAAQDWTVQARMLADVGEPIGSLRVYLRGLAEALDEENYFLAAYYLKHGIGDLVEPLFQLALERSVAEDDLWWQVRAYEELGWLTEKKATLLAHADEIRQSDDLRLQLALAEAEDNKPTALALRKQIVVGEEEFIRRVDPDG